MYHQQTKNLLVSYSPKKLGLRSCDLSREAAERAPAEGDVSPQRTFTEAFGRSRESNRR